MIKTYSRKKKPESCASSDLKLTSKTKALGDDEDEKKHFQRVVSAFECYRSHLTNKINLSKQLLESLPDYQQDLLKSYRDSLTQIEKCVDHNQLLINAIVKDVQNMFENTNHTDINTMNNQKPSAMDIERVQTTLKQFVRDWSKEGEEERNSCYQPIIDEVVRNFPPDKWNTKHIKVLVPGSGLGRLAFEIANRGYCCQGNEFSLFMLFASNFVLNKCLGTNVYSLYPWIHQVDNNLSVEHQMQLIRFPDVNPSVLLKHVPTQFSMAAGDFLDIYKNAEEWHCITTCFFIDCANNIVNFIEKIFYILKPGGIWVNLGPLLYHFSNMPGEFSIEPPYNVVKEVIIGVGFKFEKEETGMKTKYSQNPNSMLQFEYNSVFFVCRKPL